MSGISTNVGLMSGLNTSELIGQLMEIERVPIGQLEDRITVETDRQAAVSDISAKILLMQTTANTLGQESLFKSVTAASSNESLIKASVTGEPATGAYSFTPARMATAQQVTSQGFVNPESSTVGAGTITIGAAGSQVNRATTLESLNGFAGVQQGSINITQADGTSAVVDLSSVVNINEVVDRINSNGSLSVTASVVDNHIQLTDNSGGAGTLSVQDAGPGTTATSLGLTSLSATGNTYAGSDINFIGASTLLSALNDGLGVDTSQGVPELTVTTDDGTFNINLDNVSTVGQLAELIDTETAGAVALTMQGDRLALTDTNGGTGITVASASGTTAAEDLGLAGTTAGDTLTGGRVLADINDSLLSSLNGGSGVAGGSISITDRSGNTSTIDLAGAESLNDVIDAINNDATLNVTARVADNGTSLVLSDTTGTGSLVVQDVDSTTAADLGIETAGFSGAEFEGTSIARQFVSESTQLSTLNGGQGVDAGQFRVTDANGVSAVVDISQATDDTLGDVIRDINSRPTQITARINDTGDGIVLEDTSGGAGTLRVDEVNGGTTAADLNILGSAPQTDPTRIDGSFATSIEVLADDSLQDVVDKITASGARVNASIVNVGGATPYRLNLTSSRSGAAGAMVIDTGGTSLNFSTIQQAQDAVLTMGGADNPIVMTSADNTFDDVVDGMSLEIGGTSSTPVTVSVQSDRSKVGDYLKKFVDSYNEIAKAIKDVTKYDAEEEERGLLMGDSAILRTERAMRNMVMHRFGDMAGSVKSLKTLGIDFTQTGTITFDRAKFDQAMATNPADVERFFLAESQTDDNDNVTSEGGFAESLENFVEKLTDSKDGVLTRRSQSYANTVEQYNERIATLEKRMVAKESSLRRQFTNLEMVLARLQDQQKAIANFPTWQFNNGNSGGQGQ